MSCWEDAMRRVLSEALDGPCALRQTDESVHHQKRLARRLEVASLVFSSWTKGGSIPNAIADATVDGRIQTMQNFVQEAAAEDEAGYGTMDERTGERASKRDTEKNVLAHLSDLSDTDRSQASPSGGSAQDATPSKDQVASGIHGVASRTRGVANGNDLEIDVRHVDDLSYCEFWVRYMHANRPVLIRGVTRHWRASREWTHGSGIDVEALSKRFGDSKVWATHCRACGGKSPGERIETTVADYVRYWQKHRANGEAKAIEEEDPLLYLKDWHFTKDHEDYVAYETPEYFREDWLNEYYDGIRARQRTGSADLIPEFIDQTDYRFVYLGPKGTKTGLHADVLRSYSWSANVSGRKLWKFLPPQFTHLLYDTFGSRLAASFDEGVVDEDRFPNLKYARKHVVQIIQKEDEAIFVPSGWHHTVENLEDTLSINHNWINACNIHYSLELLERERHEATQAICDCRSTCASDEEFEQLVQRNLAANSSMNYESFSDWLLLIIGNRMESIRQASAEQGEKETGSLKYLTQAYEVKLAYVAVSKLLYNDRVGVLKPETKQRISKAMEEVAAELSNYVQA